MGQVVSADVAVPERERVLRFYARVLGTGAEPLWRDDLLNNRGVPIIGLGERTPEYEVLPLQWMPHIQVADVGASAARAVAAGGTELLHGRDDDGASQWAVLTDPDGAAFGLIPVVPASELPSGDDGANVGRIAWLDLTVPNAEAARTFYEDVIGWRPSGCTMTDANGAYEDYAMLGADGTELAGICHARGANAGLPAVWLLYLPVGDFDESLRLVVEEGGEVIAQADGGHRYAVVRDPVGACVALVPG